MTTPSIVLITADQLRKDALGCYGNQIIHTPNLDRLAAQSIQFDSAYTASPWCLPSRCALVTGQYPHNNGAYSNFRDCRLDPQIPNLYNTLHAAGYISAHIGKCHYAPVLYGETRADQTLPYQEFRDYYLSLGMDYLALQDDKQVSVWFRDDYADELDRAGHLEAYRAAVWNRDHRKVFDFPGPAVWHPDSWVGRKATKYVRDYHETQPLFLWVSFSGPHFPFDAPAEYHNRIDMQRLGLGHFQPGEFDKGDKIHATSYHGGGRIEGCGSAPDRACKNYTDDYWRDLRRNYFANVALIDDQVGDLLAAVQERFGDDVLVIFTADHGEMLGSHRLWGKHNCGYEDVLNVPLLVRYPNQPEHQRTDVKVMLTDIMATCLKAAQVADPPPTGGVDFAELAAQGGHPYVFAEGDGFFTISDGRHKLVRVVQDIGVFTEFHDLAADPQEIHNFAGDPSYAAPQTEIQTVALDFLIRSLLP